MVLAIDLQFRTASGGSWQTVFDANATISSSTGVGPFAERTFRASLPDGAAEIRLRYTLAAGAGRGAWASASALLYADGTAVQVAAAQAAIVSDARPVSEDATDTAPSSAAVHALAEEVRNEAAAATETASGEAATATGEVRAEAEATAELLPPILTAGVSYHNDSFIVGSAANRLGFADSGHFGEFGSAQG